MAGIPLNVVTNKEATNTNDQTSDNPTHDPSAITTPNNKAGSYNSDSWIRESDIKLSEETKALIKQASEVYDQNNPTKRTWYGRCIFISWYCALDCTFCFRATDSHNKRHATDSKRSHGSTLLEALFCKLFNWRIEFLTGGIGMMPDNELIEYARTISKVYGEKIWLNIGTLTTKRIDELLPYIKGVCGSMETLHPELHKEVCPSKPIKPYDEMFTRLREENPEIKRSIAVICGLGDTLDDLTYLYNFIEKHQLHRITLYALKPVKGGAFTQGPSVDFYASWIASIRIRFPKLEIIAGTNLRRCEEVGTLLKAGASAFTKFPATKQFATSKARLLARQTKDNGRNFISNFTELKDKDGKDINFEAEIDKLQIEEHYKEQMKEKLPNYLKVFLNPKDKDKQKDTGGC